MSARTWMFWYVLFFDAFPDDVLIAFLDIPRLRSIPANVCHSTSFRWRSILTGYLKLISEYRLMKEASINAKQAGERGISAKSIKKVTEVRTEYQTHAITITDRISGQVSLLKFKGWSLFVTRHELKNNWAVGVPGIEPMHVGFHDALDRMSHRWGSRAARYYNEAVDQPKAKIGFS